MSSFTSAFLFLALISLPVSVEACPFGGLTFESNGPIAAAPWANVFTEFVRVAIETKALEPQEVGALIENPFSPMKAGFLKGHDFEKFHRELLETAPRLEDKEATRLLIAEALAPFLTSLGVRDKAQAQHRNPAIHFGLEARDGFAGRPESINAIFSDGSLGVTENGVVDLKTGKQIPFPIRDGWWSGKNWKFSASGSSDTVLVYAPLYPVAYFWNVKTGTTVKLSPRAYRPWLIRRFADGSIPSHIDWKASGDGKTAIVLGITGSWNQIHNYNQISSKPGDAAVATFDIASGKRKAFWPRKDPKLAEAMTHTSLNSEPHLYDISHDGSIVFFNAGTAVLRWDTRNDGISRIFDSPNLGQVAMRGGGTGAIVLRSHSSNRSTISWGHHVPGNRVDFENSGIASDDGRWVMSNDSGRDLKEPARISVTDTFTGRSVVKVEAPAGVRAVGFLPGSNGIVLQMPGKWIKTYRLETQPRGILVTLDEAGNVAN